MVAVGGNKYEEQATWWKDSAVREVLQRIFQGTDVDDLIVPVKKVTSKFCNENNGYENWEVTADKAFLLSETELYGKQYLSPAIEGQIYEYYAYGASRFFWGEEILGNKQKYLGGAGYSIWMRSSAQRDTAKANATLNNSTQVRKATCRVFNSIASLEPTLLCSHGYSIAEGAGGYYVPAFCL
jgi:hypothetical protein